MNHILIKNAKIIDGSGNNPFEADLRIEGEKIVQIGSDLPKGDAFLLNADGLVVCPGFIDMHSHADLCILQQPAPDQKIRQGVTTELMGQDGLGVAPVDQTSLPDLQEIISGLQGRIPSEQWTWENFSGYLERLESTGLPNNVAVLATHAPLRLMTIGMEERAPSRKETEKMQHLLEECFQSGAFGFSTGLEYPPQCFADIHELTELNKTVARYDGLYVVHQRNEGFRLEESFSEQLAISRAANVRLHISHLKAWGKANWHRIDTVIEAAEDFHSKGGRISWDRYPYLSASTLLGIVLPQWSWAQGTAALIRNLADKDFRSRLRVEFQRKPEEWDHDPGSVGWNNLFVSGVNKEENRWMEGKSLSAIALQTGKDEVDLICDLLHSERLAVTGIFFYGSDVVLDKVLAHPLGYVGSDGILLGKPHPRLYGSFPHFLERFSIQRSVLSLEEAIRKITSMPAKTLGLHRRGLIEEGWYADIVVLAPDQVHAPLDYQNTQIYPEGIEQVFLNGRWVVKFRKYQGVLAGSVLKKKN